MYRCNANTDMHRIEAPLADIDQLERLIIEARFTAARTQLALLVFTLDMALVEIANQRKMAAKPELRLAV